MLYRENTVLGPKVSVIGFGGAAVSGEGGGYGFGNMAESEAEALLKQSFELGINLYDTAPIYGFGLSEERFGKYLPKEALVVSKGGVDWHNTKRVNMSNDPKIIERMLLESLKRLKRERLDVYMIHWPDKNVDIRRPMEVLARYQERSAIHHIGLCNTHTEDLKKAQEMAKVSILQSELNALSTQGFDQLNDQWKNYFSMSWGTFDKGILTGRVKEGRVYDKSDARSWAPWWNKKEVAAKIERVKKLETILGDYQVSLSEFCLHFNLNLYGISSCLIGLKNKNDLVEMTSNLQKNLKAQTVKEVIDRWNK